MIRQIAIGLVLGMPASAGWAEEAKVLAAARAVAAGFRTKTPVRLFDPALTIVQGRRVQKLVVGELGKDFGPVAGYKAALTNAAARRALGIDAPLCGILLEKMLIGEPAEVRMPFAAVGVYEADLLVRVSSDAINEARTPAEALAALDAVFPFVELADRVYVSTIRPTAALALAANTGARLGVVGKPISIDSTKNWPERLGRFRVEIEDEKGRVLATGAGADLLGHPLACVIFLRDSLRADGFRLKKGDLLSLGSLTAAQPARPGTACTVRYLDLDPRGSVELIVRFRP